MIYVLKDTIEKEIADINENGVQIVKVISDAELATIEGNYLQLYKSIGFLTKPTRIAALEFILDKAYNLTYATITDGKIVDALAAAPRRFDSLVFWNDDHRQLRDAIMNAFNNAYPQKIGGFATKSAVWKRTTQKVKLNGKVRTVYKNAKTGEQRIRKMVARNGKKKIVYVKF